MAELPQRGPHVEHSASNTDQALNEAAFDPNNREMLRRINTPQPEQADLVSYADDNIDEDADLDHVTLYTDTDDEVYRAPIAPARPATQRPRRWVA